MKCLGEGPVPARIMIVAEAPGAEEEKLGKPFVGSSGQELTRMLHEAGIIRSECFVTNVCRFRPPNNDIEEFIPVAKRDITPDCIFLHNRYVKPVVYQGYEELLAEIVAVKPNLILACGNVSLWALTSKWGITSWRGSLLESVPIPGLQQRIKVIPTYHPAAILRQWEWRPITIHDLKRARAESEFPERRRPLQYKFTTAPTYQEVMSRLDWLYQQAELGPLDLAVDLETRWKRHIACIGLAWSKTEAICIPLMDYRKPDGYWLEEQEAEIIYTLNRLLAHPNCQVIGQNFLYDTQYIYKHWRFVPNVAWDTMSAHHVMFVNFPRGLDFQSSLYCEDHVYWKDDYKEWDSDRTQEENWIYNCTDAVRTFEIKKVQESALRTYGLEQQFAFKMALWWACFEAMLVGMRLDQAKRVPIGQELAREMAEISKFFVEVLGHPLNPRSNPQMKKLFYDDLQAPKQLHHKTKRLTLDEQALEKIAAKEPLLRPLISAIEDQRTLGVLKSTFIESEVSEDGRMRCMIDPNGTVTFRLSTYEDAFGTGMNMQNLPSDKSKMVGKAAKRIRVEGMELKLPNIRELFLPDEGMIIFEADLDRADLQTVVWEANAPLLKAALRQGVDIHLLGACILSGKEPPPLEELVETHPEYPKWRSIYKLLREFAKVFCHGTNYGGSAKTMAGHCGVLVHEAEKAQRAWFGANPGIKEWHRRTELQLAATRSVSNRFGLTATFFGRVETLLPEALAWVPQSTTAEVIERGWTDLLAAEPLVRVLMQVHDSLVGQFAKESKDEMLPRIKQHLSILVPYDDPLVIPVGIKVSEVSWGQCK